MNTSQIVFNHVKILRSVLIPLIHSIWMTWLNNIVLMLTQSVISQFSLRCIFPCVYQTSACWFALFSYSLCFTITVLGLRIILWKHLSFEKITNAIVNVIFLNLCACLKIVWKLLDSCILSVIRSTHDHLSSSLLNLMLPWSLRLRTVGWLQILWKMGNNSGYFANGRSMHDHFSVSLKCNAWDGDKYCENGE
jgi:hypothetical protein